MSSSLTATRPPKRIVHLIVCSGYSPFVIDCCWLRADRAASVTTDFSLVAPTPLVSASLFIRSRYPSPGQSPKVFARQSAHPSILQRPHHLPVDVGLV